MKSLEKKLKIEILISKNVKGKKRRILEELHVLSCSSTFQVIGQLCYIVNSMVQKGFDLEVS